MASQKEWFPKREMWVFENQLAHFVNQLVHFGNFAKHPKSETAFFPIQKAFFLGDFFEDLSCCVQINGGNRTAVRVPENILAPSLTICDIEIRCRKKGL